MLNNTIQIYVKKSELELEISTVVHKARHGVFSWDAARGIKYFNTVGKDILKLIRPSLNSLIEELFSKFQQKLGLACQHSRLDEIIDTPAFVDHKDSTRVFSLKSLFQGDESAFQGKRFTLRDKVFEFTR